AVGTIPELLATDHPWIQDYFMGPRGRAAQTAQDRQERRSISSKSRGITKPKMDKRRVRRT
ncbi:MAG: hypothetical protein WA908_02380, partial [Pontixanthobacter sp.]